VLRNAGTKHRYPMSRTCSSHSPRKNASLVAAAFQYSPSETQRGYTANRLSPRELSARWLTKSSSKRRLSLKVERENPFRRVVRPGKIGKRMSALGQKRTLPGVHFMSALPPKADIG
jgi:hypothetical protein